jgi:exodeoxyribonuclease V beta subunit
MSQPLNALNLPLWGSRLIEASAGTGKTWTIAALAVRLVLGHGGDNGFARPLLPGEILVMTFTRAATRELADRIRSRLLEAAACFRGSATPQAGDVFLAELLLDFPEGPARSAAAWRLAMAAESMDDAAVHTIDAWCQRMLREHAFDSGCRFDEELSANEQTMQREAALDYWRQQVYPLSAKALELALTVWPAVGSLIDESRLLVEEPLPDGAGQGRLADLIQGETTGRHAAIAALKSGWARRALEMRAWLDRQLAAPNCRFNRHKLQAQHYKPWLKELAAWAHDPDTERPDLKKGALRLTPIGLQEAVRPGESVALPEHFAAFAELMLALDRLPPLAVQLRLHAAACIGQRLAQLKEQAGSFGFADMLNRLDTALDPLVNGAAAGRLRARIRNQYPVALIDEFQDTSPVQSSILDRVYGIGRNDRDTALLLIGDPKQSIYGFRGADIYSYLAARRATASRQYMLDTNHRSKAALVDAVNQLFGRAEGQGEGAFMYRADASDDLDADAMSAVLGEGPLPFVPVRARGRAEEFVSSNDTSVALEFELDDRLLDVTTSRREFAARCAQRIVELLNDTGAGFQRLVAGEATFTRLLPADIAVLVRTGKEAAAVRRELHRRGVTSVYLSDQDSVFDSDEARDVLHWLRAVATPRDNRLVRAALATATIGLPLDELLRLASDDAAFDTFAEQLRELHQVWQGQGVLSMLRQTLHVFGLPGRWLHPRSDGVDGERRLTNFLHLAELLQAASAQVVGEQALIRWLASQREEAASDGDEQIVRLESDADLVKVVTVHKAKGLEYPLVFLPFPCSFRAVTRARRHFLSLPGASGRRELHFEPDNAQIAAADNERLREDLRLLYVALTRARHAVWVGLAALKVGQGKHCLWHRSAIGYALGGGQPCEPAALRGQVEALVRSGADIALRMADPAERMVRTALAARDAVGPLRVTPPYTAAFERHWSIGSFSSMVRTLTPATAWASSAAAARDDEAPGDEWLTALVDTAAHTAPWHAFARGAATGNALHDQLEWLAGEGFALARSPELRQQLLRRCERQGFATQSPLLVDWLSEVVHTPLPPIGVALDGIAKPLPEMEFWLPSAGLPAGEVDALCRAHLLHGRERPALPPRDLRGMLMGFADLVFEHRGRYWVLDYKSNYLGASDHDYGEQALESAMTAHRYDVQAALYLVALHRLLRARLGRAYTPERQLGGALFLFLRGVRGPVRGCCHIVAPIGLLEALDALLGGVEEPAG